MVNCHRLPQICVISGVNVLVSHGSPEQGWGNHGSWGDELRLLDVRESLEGFACFARGGEFAGVFSTKKNAQKPCIFIPFHPQRRWYHDEDVMFCGKGPPVSLLKGTGKSMVFEMLFSKFLLRMRFVKKDMLNFIPNFDHLNPFDTTSRNLPNYLVRWCSTIFPAPFPFSMGFVA